MKKIFALPLAVAIGLGFGAVPATDARRDLERTVAADVTNRP